MHRIRTSTAPGEQATAGFAVPRLRRVLRLRDLVFYGIVLIQPIAPIPLFGIAQKLSNGHFVTTIFIAMFAMMITAFSYGRMAAIYPSAGSAYTYVGRGLNPHLGFLVGWAMVFDYLLLPLIVTIWVAITLHTRYLPGIPYSLLAFIFATLATAMNLRGIKASSRTNTALLVVMVAAIAAFMGLAIRYLFHSGGLHAIFSIEPFYARNTFDAHRIWSATSFAALTYIGFDGVSTLSEEVENPKRNVLRATVLVCLATGILGGLEVYLGQRVWPDWRSFPNLESAFMDVCRLVGGAWLFHLMGVILLVSMLGTALTAGSGAARLLFSMGRDGILPRRIFGNLWRDTGVPVYNILIVGSLACAGAVSLGYIGNAFEYGGEMVNFGAFLAFMGVNVAAFFQFTLRREHRDQGRSKPLLRLRAIGGSILPLSGFVFCALIWWQLNVLAKVVGGIWLTLGFIHLAIKTRGFRVPPPTIEFGDTQGEVATSPEISSESRELEHSASRGDG
jgi:amino acid transporter